MHGRHETEKLIVDYNSSLNEQEAVFENLTAGATYKVTVYAVNNTIKGPEKSAEATLCMCIIIFSKLKVWYIPTHQSKKLI